MSESYEISPGDVVQVHLGAGVVPVLDPSLLTKSITFDKTQYAPGDPMQIVVVDPSRVVAVSASATLHDNSVVSTTTKVVSPPSTPAVTPAHVLTGVSDDGTTTVYSTTA